MTFKQCSATKVEIDRRNWGQGMGWETLVWSMTSPYIPPSLNTFPPSQILTASQSAVPCFSSENFLRFLFVFQIFDLQLADCQTFLRPPRRFPPCIHQKVSRPHLRKIEKCFRQSIICGDVWSWQNLENWETLVNLKMFTCQWWQIGRRVSKSLN